MSQTLQEQIDELRALSEKLERQINQIEIDLSRRIDGIETEVNHA